MPQKNEAKDKSLNNIENKYTIGIDFGKNGCRALLCSVADGSEVACVNAEYSDGIMINNFYNGMPLPANWAVSNPQDYLEVIYESVTELMEQNRAVDAQSIIGLGLAFSSCCLLPVKADGTPLSDLAEFRNNPHAYIKVTRHRSAEAQASKIEALALEMGEPWVSVSKNVASSEWLLPKVLEILEQAPEVYEAADYFVEATDWLVWQLTGVPIRNSFSASFKAQCSGDNMPSSAFLERLDPRLKDLYQTKLNLPIASPVEYAGGLTKRMAKRLGLAEGTAVAVGGVDVLDCLPALNVCTPGGLVGILGNSAMFVTLNEKCVDLPGISRGVKGSIIPDYYTYKSNLPCMGDTYAWFLTGFLSPEYHTGAKIEGRNLHSYIAQRMMRLAPGENGIIALDWLNGSKCPLKDARLSGMFVGVDINTCPEHIYRAIIEGMVFDTRCLIEEYGDAGIVIDSFYGVGTIAERNPFITQLYADILKLPVYVAGTSKTPALGAGIIAATVSGAYGDIGEAAAAMSKLKQTVYTPNPEAVAVYDGMYAEYKKLRAYFSVENASVMHNLKDIKALAEKSKRK
jgi:L-ribulokinase